MLDAAVFNGFLKTMGTYQFWRLEKPADRFLFSSLNHIIMAAACYFTTVSAETHTIMFPAFGMDV